ncbi:MAG: FAD:protein FMN transferase [Desulfovibrionaceae bacterium]
MQHEHPTRRRFLAACAALGLGALAVPLLPAASAAARLAPGLVRVSRTQPLMGTFVSIIAVHESRAFAEEAVGRAFEAMHADIAVFNRFDPASPLSVLNDQGVLKGAPRELLELLDESRNIHALTGGAFDPTVKPIIDCFRSRADQDGDFHLDRAERDELLALVGLGGVRSTGDGVRFARAGMGLTLDGVAKGRVADRASERLSAMGCANHLVNAGGDIRLASDERLEAPWTVAIQAPEGGESPSVIHLRNGAVATSGSYEIAFDRHRVHHHIVDPRTALSPGLCSSATVTAGTVMQADALATAAFVLPPRAGFELIDALPGAEALLITDNGTALPTRRWGFERS